MLCIKKEYNIFIYKVRLQMRRHRGGANFTHFASLPFIGVNVRHDLTLLEDNLLEAFNKRDMGKYLTRNNPNLFHLTLSMLTLPHQNQRVRVQQLLQDNKGHIYEWLKSTYLTTTQIGYFTRRNNNKSGNKQKQNNINVIYLDLQEDAEYMKIEKVTDFFLRLFLKEEIIADSDLKSMNIEYDHRTNMFKNKKFHITLFRCQGLTENQEFFEVYEEIKNIYSGKKIEIQSFDISTRFDYDNTKFYTPLYRVPIASKKQSQ